MKFKYCPFCSHETTDLGDYYLCSSCKEKYYKPIRACVSIIPIEYNKILLAVRGQEPFKGEYDLIGGFVNKNETIEQAAIREVKEETNLNVDLVEYIGSYPDTYGDKENFTIGITYLAEIKDGEPKAQDDVKALEWVNIKDIPNLKLNGFKNTKEVLSDLYKSHIGRELGE